MFMWYLLVRLVREKQVVLLHMAPRVTVLFYHDEVFVAAADTLRLSLPHHRDNKDELACDQVCIWSLFDISIGEPTPDFGWRGICYPVTTSAPNHDRLRHFNTSSSPYVGCLPLWTLKELRNA